MAEGLPWGKFVWSKWLSDARLRACSYAARGLWMDMLCYMDASEEKGFLLVGSRAATSTEIARIVGGERRMVERLLAELEAHGVFSRDNRGAIFNRKMARDHVKSRENIANGKLGGNPNLKKNNELPEKTVNPSVKADKEEDIEREKESNTPIPPFGVQPQAAPSALNGAKDALPKRARFVPGEAPAFDEFWRRYPRKIEGPVAAKKAWDKAIAGGAEPNAIIGGVARYPFDARDGGKYIPQATTWLNQSRWTTQADTLPLAPIGPRKTTPTYGSPY